MRALILFLSLTFLSSSCSEADEDTGNAASVACAGLIESACKAQDKCNVISGTELSTKKTLYMGCLKDNGPSGLTCDSAIGCYVDKNGDHRTMTPNLCAPEDWKYVQCTQEDFDQSK